MTDYSLYNVHGQNESIKTLTKILQTMDEKSGLYYWNVVYYADNGDMMILVENNSQAYFLMGPIYLSSQF
jgi:hypothetical protein